MRPRQGPSVRHRVEDGVKKHRGSTAASSLRVSRHVTLRKAPSSSSATQQSKSRTARTSRAAGAYLRTRCIRWVPVRVLSGVWPRLCDAHPNVSAKLPSKGKRVRYLGLARARMTLQACAYAFAHEMHAHSHRPSHRRGSHEHAAYRLGRKRTDSMLRAECLRWNCACHGILHSHIPSASTGNQCRCVCVCVHACVVNLRAR